MEAHSRRLDNVCRSLLLVTKASNDKLNRLETTFQGRELHLKSQIQKLSSAFEACQRELAECRTKCEEEQATNQILRREIEERNERTREDMTAMRKDLREQIAYA